MFESTRPDESATISQTGDSSWWSVVLAGCFVMIVAAHLFGLYSVRSFDQQQLAWNSGTEARSQIAADHDAQLESTKKAMTEHASTLWTARAEADKATEETSRLLAELAQIQTQLAEQKKSQQSATHSETRRERGHSRMAFS